MDTFSNPLSEALILYKWISAFLTLPLVDEFNMANIFLHDNMHGFTKQSPQKDIAKAKIDTFESKVSKFYEIGYSTFCTTKTC